MYSFQEVDSRYHYLDTLTLAQLEEEKQKVTTSGSKDIEKLDIIQKFIEAIKQHVSEQRDEYNVMYEDRGEMNPARVERLSVMPESTDSIESYENNDVYNAAHDRVVVTRRLAEDNVHTYEI